jgi:hypothetical protein
MARSIGWRPTSLPCASPGAAPGSPIFRISRVRTFDTVEVLSRALLEFRETCNASWSVERHGFRPLAVPAEQLPPAALAG